MPENPFDSLIRPIESFSSCMVGRLILSLAFGVAVSLLYRWSGRPDHTSKSRLGSSLVLLAVLIAMVTQVVGDSVARAFSLVGALSVVRFRTPLEDTRDTAFVLFAVIIGMAIGVGQPLLALVGYGIVLVATLGYRWNPDSAAGSVWLVDISRTNGQSSEAVISEALQLYCTSRELWASRSHKKSESHEYRYHIRLKSGTEPMMLVNLLSGMEGIISVEMNPVT